MKLVASVALVGLVVPTWALAQEPAHFVFVDGESVSGTTVGPDMFHLEVQGPVRRTGLIKIRENFVPEIVRSAEAR